MFNESPLPKTVFICSGHLSTKSPQWVITTSSQRWRANALQYWTAEARKCRIPKTTQCCLAEWTKELVIMHPELKGGFDDLKVSGNIIHLRGTTDEVKDEWDSRKTYGHKNEMAMAFSLPSGETRPPCSRCARVFLYNVEGGPAYSTWEVYQTPFSCAECIAHCLCEQLNQST